MTTSAPSAGQVLVPLSRLGHLTRLAEGTQGVISRTDRLVLRHSEHAILKQYKPAALSQLDAGGLTAMVEFLFSLPQAEGDRLLDYAAWPVRIVVDGAGPVGFVMPPVPQQYWIDLTLPSGAVRRVLGQFQHLLNADEFSARKGLVVGDEVRVRLALSVAFRLEFLHARNVVVGDLSPRNLLFSIDPQPSCYFVDCDSMVLAGRSALPQLETPDWHVRAVSREPLATEATDRYKLALLVLRLLSRGQSSYHTAELPDWSSPVLAPLIVAGLSADPAGRPTPAQWVDVLNQAKDLLAGPPVVYRPAHSPSGLRRGETEPRIYTPPGSAFGGFSPVVSPPPSDGN